ncbi:hypothetical protein IQ273_28405 [Nodosilinea sp. LEGE 07298]|uniref:hypothetical protein n=1 Tax=Nodosilinea sp. LEGE 07298 TaxID=2777970 RepID=UPI00187EF460|nr:hypothetical protein [Nodosilinea sp. LEGE 07298]MBE9113303.1 hypothetical protein [Nodosilinea sp. LEGE 07298]
MALGCPISEVVFSNFVKLALRSWLGTAYPGLNAVFLMGVGRLNRNRAIASQESGSPSVMMGRKAKE